MHLSPREQERLLLAAAADLARRRIARGSKIGATEAIALLCDEIQEWAWDDVPLEEVIARAQEVVPTDALLPGVSAAVPIVQIEALFPHGTVLVSVSAPFGPPAGAGAVRLGDGAIELAPGRQRDSAELHNTGPLPIWVSSHVPLDQLNPALQVITDEPADYRLDVAAGVAIRIDPGVRRTVQIVQIVRDRG